jgi:hypothetical protein
LVPDCGSPSRVAIHVDDAARRAGVERERAAADEGTSTTGQVECWTQRCTT